MSRTPRKQSEANIYHVFARGVGRQTIFEDTEDSRFFCRLLERFIKGAQGFILAWCLMGNHFHLLLRMEISELSAFMKRLEVAYSLYFNARYDRVGCLFQGRFGSEPILSDAQLLAAVRYIHRNPQEAGLAQLSVYSWSSYSEYLAAEGICETRLVTELIGGIEEFERFHQSNSNEFDFMEESTDAGRQRSARLTDSSVKQMLRDRYGANWRTDLLQDAKLHRDKTLYELKKNGATIRQIARLTGIGRGIIQKARI